MGVIENVGQRQEIEKIGAQIVDAAVQIHRALGPGLLESAYQECLAYELDSRGALVEAQVPLPVVYKNVRLDTGYRVDIWVNRSVVIENKTVDRLLPIHEAQLLTYLKLSGCRLGYLLNWKVAVMRAGIKRMVMDL